MTYDFVNNVRVLCRDMDEVLFLEPTRTFPGNSHDAAVESSGNEPHGIVMERGLAERMAKEILGLLESRKHSPDDGRLTPRRVTHEASIRRLSTCPSCKNVVDEWTDLSGHKENVAVPYCKFCGQALLWN